MKIKKILLGVCVLVLLWTEVVFAEGEDVKTIEKFEVVNEFYRGTNVTIYYKMPLEELVAEKLPASYDVYLRDEEGVFSVPVEWECLDDYENSVYGVYTFVPKLADSNYILSDDLGIFDLPYAQITVDSEIGQPGLTILIKVQTPDEKIYEIKAYQTFDIAHVKDTMEKITGIEVENQQILFNGSEVEEKKSLEECEIHHGSVLTLLNLEDIDAPKAEETEENAVNDDTNDSKPEENIELSSDEEPSDEIQTEINIVKVEDQEQVTNRAVKTGDTGMAMPWLILFVMSVAGIVTMIEVKTRKR